MPSCQLGVVGTVRVVLGFPLSLGRPGVESHVRLSSSPAAQVSISCGREKGEELPTRPLDGGPGWTSAAGSLCGLKATQSRRGQHSEPL